MAIRLVLAVLLIVVGLAEMFLPGPAMLFFFLALLLLGVTLETMIRLAGRLVPGFTEERAESVLRHPWLRRFARRRSFPVRDPAKSGERSEDGGKSG